MLKIFLHYLILTNLVCFHIFIARSILQIVCVDVNAILLKLLLIFVNLISHSITLVWIKLLIFISKFSCYCRLDCVVI